MGSGKLYLTDTRFLCFCHGKLCPLINPLTGLGSYPLGLIISNSGAAIAAPKVICDLILSVIKLGAIAPNVRCAAPN